MTSPNKKERTRGLFDNKKLSEAVRLVMQQKWSVRHASQACHINRTTLGRYVKQAQAVGSSNIEKRSMVTKQVKYISSKFLTNYYIFLRFHINLFFVIILHSSSTNNAVV